MGLMKNKRRNILFVKVEATVPPVAGIKGDSRWKTHSDSEDLKKVLMKANSEAGVFTEENWNRNICSSGFSIIYVE